MKKQLLPVLFFFIYCSSYCQPASYWQQKVNYKIDVSLNPTEKTLDGFISMQYFNNSPDTLRFIWFHTWPNAYKNDRTAFSEQLLAQDKTNFYFSNEEKKGYINRLDFKVDKNTAIIEDHPQHQDIIKLLLPKPLPPGASINIETPFHVKLPYNISRGGYIGESFQVTQWYPKPAVYDKTGWHEMPYLDQGEFYSEFGEYNVQITVPKEYVVAATGVLKTETGSGNIKTLAYIQDRVHDFAWFADKNFSVKHDTLQLATHIVDVYAYYNIAHAEKWRYAVGTIKTSILNKSKLVGEYPYDVVSIVEKPGKDDGDGMEYPTIALVSNPYFELVDHEVGHNWFYGIIATNERLHPWMDEGINTYYDKRYESEHFRTMPAKSSFFTKRVPFEAEQWALNAGIAIKKDQPIEESSENFTEINYGLVVYYKTGKWMELLEKELGKPLFDSVMHEYYDRWKFKHPQPEDFKQVVEEVSKRNLDPQFALLNKKGPLEKQKTKDLKFTSFFSLKNTDKHNYIFLAPAIGYNYYDKFMVGAILHNYTVPETKLRFILVPLYGTGSKEMNGIGRISYSFFPGDKGSKFEIAVAGSKFSADEFTDSTGKKNYQPFTKIVPSLKYIFPNKSPISRTQKYIQWKTFFITETGLSFTRDTINQVDIISYPKESRYLNQLQFVIRNSRKLYPFDATFQAEQGKAFMRFNFTGNYFFNYPRGGGLSFRLFAGKFIYTKDKTFITQYETDRYHLNLSGPKGYEDYTYSDYFIGRNEFDGFSNRQIMMRDGGFKVKSDLLSDKIGKTDDWLSAVNLNTTLPKQINPLELLPGNIIKLKVFVDIGTYAEAWKNDAPTGRFLYDAGFQFSLFADVVNIYLPVLYSKVYKDYFKSTIGEKIFRKNISFSIDIQKIPFKLSQIPFRP